MLGKGAVHKNLISWGADFFPRLFLWNQRMLMVVHQQITRSVFIERVCYTVTHDYLLL